MCADSNFGRGFPDSRVEPSMLCEVLASSPRLASQGQIIIGDSRPSYQSISEGLVKKLISPSVMPLLITFEGIRLRIILDNPPSFYDRG